MTPASAALVCDASALAAVAFDEPRADSVLALARSRRLFSPTILPYELSQVALKKCRARPLDSDLIENDLADALALPLRLLAPSWLSAFRLANTHGLSVYDASYLQLALELKIPLLTLDKRLSEVAEKLGAN